jgi:hypothetical protein
MPAFGKSETELLQRYLDKDHAFRHRALEADRRALICDKFGDFRGEAFCSSGWRNWSRSSATARSRRPDWFTSLGRRSYLVAQGSGAGGFQSCAGVGTTADFAAPSRPAPSSRSCSGVLRRLGQRDNLLRAPLPPPSRTASWPSVAGRPHWYLHPMGLGEPIGHAARSPQNNRGLYVPTGGFPHAVNVALMGDPTLRLHVVAPPSALARQGRTAGLEGSPLRTPTFAYVVYGARRRDQPVPPG